MSPQDYFSDMLAPGERVVAALGAAGPPSRQPGGDARTWYQVGVTQDRVLAVKMLQAPMESGYRPSARWAVDKASLKIARFSRTPTDAARLEISGLPEPVVLLDIDDPAIFPHVEPLLIAWGGVLQGMGTVALAEADGPGSPRRGEPRLLLMVAAGGTILWMGCCGCAGLAGAIRAWVLPQL